MERHSATTGERGVRELAKTLKVLEAEGEVEITNLASHIARTPPALRARRLLRVRSSQIRR